jgi:hypothetical protein
MREHSVYCIPQCPRCGGEHEVPSSDPRCPKTGAEITVEWDKEIVRLSQPRRTIESSGQRACYAPTNTRDLQGGTPLPPAR